jgi:CheY-like chemotaxis protein
MARQTPLILVAEDDDDDRVLLRDAAEALSFEGALHFAVNGDELLDLLSECQQQQACPTLVLLDLNMPGMDGKTALREIKSSPAYADIPVVVLTTSNAEQDRHDCLEIGAEAYYQKPHSFSRLLELMDVLFSRSKVN